MPATAHEGDPKIFDVLPPVIAPAYRAAQGGVAEAVALFESENVSLLSWLPLSEFTVGGHAMPSSGNDCWGYVSPSGREYALMGLANGTAFVEVTNPSDAQIIAIVAGPQSLWRDIKVYQNYVYVVTEGGGGIQVVDVSQIDDGTVTLVNTVNVGGTGATHNVAINEESGYLYRTGGGSNGLRIYSLANPVAPLLAGEWQDRYVHDAQVVTWTTGPWAGREIAFCCAGFNGGWVETGLSIVDVTDKAAPVVLAHLVYPGGAYSHQGWLSEDRRHFYINDEADETTFGVPTTTHVIDVQDLANPIKVGTFSSGLPAIDHNLYVRGNLIFQANYRSGVRIFDASEDPVAPVPYGFFDTFPGSDSPNFNGLWSVFPFFPSGTVIGSDLERGLFVWYVGADPLRFEFPEGLPALIDPQGELLRVRVLPGEGLSIDPASVRMNVFHAEGFASISMRKAGADLYEALTPPLECTSSLAYSFTATASNGIALTGPAPSVQAIAAVEQAVLFADDMESDTGWVVGAPGDDATAGLWERVEPIGTTAQPGFDNPAGEGTYCWITGQGTPNGPAGEADVDGGSTTLTSPLLDALGGIAGGEPVIEYYRWYSNNLGNNPNSDSMPISLSNDGGQTWVLLEDVTENAGAWVRRSHRISDVLEPTATMRLRFVARDLRGPSLVEAGVDDVRIIRYGCGSAPTIPGDLDGDGFVDGADLGLLLAQWGGPGSADLDGSGAVDGGDLGILLANWSG